MTSDIRQNKTKMHHISRHLLDNIRQETILPDINSDACVHSYFNQSDCQACVDSCPSQAWLLDDESLGLNIDACNGCGQCIPACPSGALSVPYPWIIRQFGGRKIALFACEPSQIREKGAVLPCIHIMGLRQLLLLHNSGISVLLINTAECSDCDRCPSFDIHQHLKQLNKLLLERNNPPMRILQRSRKVWVKIFNTDEINSGGIKLSRRDFLRAEGQQYRRQMLVQDPLNLPECQTIPPGQLLPQLEKDELHWPWVPKMDERLCNCCDACMNLCPTDALQLVPVEDNLPTEYRLNPAHCTGCGICESVCDVKAITIYPFSLSTITRIELIEKQCSSCGNAYHLPQNASTSVELTLCRICQKFDHSSQLFQVME